MIVNDTVYSDETPIALIEVLENVRKNRTRIHVSYGDQQTGKDWLEEFQTYGYVGRSGGNSKIPLLIHNKRSFGGGALMDAIIVRIRVSNGKTILYQHPNYHTPKIQLYITDDYCWIYADGKNQARFRNVTQARRYVKKLGIQVDDWLYEKPTT